MEETERKGLPIVALADQAAWRDWLTAHHTERTGVWLKFAKKHSPHATVNYAEALEVALCFGWIDGQVNRFDDDFYLQRFTPRTPTSKWSQINVEKATGLIADGQMQPAGQAAVDAAKADGRWDAAYQAQSDTSVPADFQAALDANPKAKALFDTLTGVKRYRFVYRITTVKRAETRARKIEQYIALLNEGKTLHD